MKKLLFLTLFFFCANLSLNAQDVQAVSESPQQPRMNFVKLNITSIVLKNYAIQYERVLTKRISVGLSFRMMPSTNLPFKNSIINSMDNADPQAINAVESLKLDNIAITPEVRFYLGKKGYGRGFYIAPFYRFAKYGADNLEVNFEEEASPGVFTDHKVVMSGDLNTHTGGIMFGVQWALGKYVSLDWWILGPSFGVSSGNLLGISDTAIPADGKQEITNTINDIDIPMVEKTVSFSNDSKSVMVDLTGPWAGIRSGIVFGFKF
jgi:hypothetical protein